MKIYTYDAIVIGTGAAGYNAVCRIKQMKKKTVAIVTEGITMGTSRNTGSDKQTYYKLGLGGEDVDSVRLMADTLFAGGKVDGDHALCEAALSARCFLHLCELGVPFPMNRYGEYMGYKTDHDPYARATSAGPLTSKFMTEALQKEAERLEIEVYDGYLAIEILKQNDRVCGLLCLERKSGEYVAFRCSSIVMATGGPAGIYADSVYPKCHTGSTGLAIQAGAKLKNMTEWQYGLASVAPRWNVSGTYMQVLPRLVSVDKDGTEHEFLKEFFLDVYEAMSLVFLKGYQWPFDKKKSQNGSSQIDLWVYQECVERGRRVYLDYTKNPFELEEIEYSRLSQECRTYLEKAEACFGKPIDRLQKMNEPAIELYLSKGVDITKEYLEIALCAQHNNGGIDVDLWWQTCVSGLFAVGECAGTHGVSRPGGSALNAGQVGSFRAAQYISEYCNNLIESAEFQKILSEAIIHQTVPKTKNTGQSIINAQRRMSDSAGAVRDVNAMKILLQETKKALQDTIRCTDVPKKTQIYSSYKLKDILITQWMVLSAMLDENIWSDEMGLMIQELQFEDGEVQISWRDTRPILIEENFFETIWRGYRDNKNIY